MKVNSHVNLHTSPGGIAIFEETTASLLRNPGHIASEVHIHAASNVI